MLAGSRYVETSFDFYVTGSLAGPAVRHSAWRLSHLTGYWLTNMDLGVWSALTGLIRIGPAVTAVTQHESLTGSAYRVVGRPLTAPVALAAQGLGRALGVKGLPREQGLGYPRHGAA